MSLHMAQLEVEADLELRIPRGEVGSLDDGARTVLNKIDRVREVEVDDIGSVRPDAFDLYVDVSARLVLDVRELEEPVAVDDDVATRLRDGFGVVAIDRLTRR